MSLALHEMAWAARARCADRPSEMFYTDRSPIAGAAALECCNAAGGCPVRRACLVFAIAHTEKNGIWGGMTARARNDLARLRCDCGTMVGRQEVAAMIADAHQHIRCTHCGAWVEVLPPWERPHRNSHITGTGRRT